MQITQPLRIESGPNAGHWHMTSSSGSTPPHPVGYCANGCPGHDTAEEAVRHYHEWRADEAEIRSLEKEPCDVCDQARTHVALFSGIRSPVYLCATHANRDGVLKALSGSKQSNNSRSDE